MLHRGRGGRGARPARPARGVASASGPGLREEGAEEAAVGAGGHEGDAAEAARQGAGAAREGAAVHALQGLRGGGLGGGGAAPEEEVGVDGREHVPLDGLKAGGRVEQLPQEARDCGLAGGAAGPGGTPGNGGSQVNAEVLETGAPVLQ